MNLLPNFQKWRGEDGKEGTTFFRRESVGGEGGLGCNFYEKINLKSEIFNGKKSLQTKIFFSLITQNSNWEVLIMNLVTFKR